MLKTIYLKSAMLQVGEHEISLLEWFGDTANFRGNIAFESWKSLTII